MIQYTAKYKWIATSEYTKRPDKEVEGAEGFERKLYVARDYYDAMYQALKDVNEWNRGGAGKWVYWVDSVKCD